MPRQCRKRCQQGDGIKDVFKWVKKAASDVAKNPVVKTLMKDVVMPMVQAKITKKMGGKGLRLAGGGLKLAGEGRKAAKPRAAKPRAVKRQTVYY